MANVGNFHTLAFRLGPGGIEGVFEHHTGEIDRPRLEGFLRSLAQGTLTNAEVFDSMGHGALVYNQEPFSLEESAPPRLVVTGPRRRLLAGSSLRPYFAVPFGDMMITGCFGLISAAADVTAGPVASRTRHRRCARLGHCAAGSCTRQQLRAPIDETSLASRYNQPSAWGVVPFALEYIQLA